MSDNELVVKQDAEAMAELFDAWWRVNHPWDWWAKSREGEPLSVSDRLLVADLCKRAFLAASLVVQVDAVTAVRAQLEAIRGCIELLTAVADAVEGGECEVKGQQ